MRAINSGNIFASLMSIDVAIVMFSSQNNTRVNEEFYDSEKKINDKSVMFGIIFEEISSDLVSEYFVESIPSILFFRKGELVKSFPGTLSTEDLRKASTLLSSK